MNIKKNHVSAIDLTTDGHVHTRLCHHARGEMEEYVLSAIDKGLKRIIFLEHFEVGIRYFEQTWLSENDFAFYHHEGDRLREKYKDTIEIGTGVEVGFNPDYIKETSDFLSQCQWARVALSYHFLKTKEGHVNMVSRRQHNLDAMVEIGVDVVVSSYFEGLVRALEIFNPDVVCHLDAVLRHYPGISFSEAHLESIKKILAIMKQKDVALEINTSGFKLRGEPFPALTLIQQARTMGIRLVVGSDAHRPEDVGRYFDKLPLLLDEKNSTH